MINKDDWQELAKRTGLAADKSIPFVVFLVHQGYVPDYEGIICSHRSPFKKYLGLSAICWANTLFIKVAHSPHFKGYWIRRSKDRT